MTVQLQSLGSYEVNRRILQVCTVRLPKGTSVSLLGADHVCVFGSLETNYGWRRWR